MKRILTLMFTAVLLFSLTACAQKPVGRAEVCRGYIEEIFTEGSGADKAEVVKLSSGEETLYVTIEENSKYFRHRYDPDSSEIIAKDELFIGAYVQVEYAVFEDSGYHPIQTITIIDEDRVLEVMDHTVRRIGGTEFDAGTELADTDAEMLKKILQDHEWKEGSSDCAFDYSFNLEGIIYQYHSECGTFEREYFSKISSFSSIEPPEKQSTSICLEEKDRAAVNAILEQYE